MKKEREIRCPITWHALASFIGFVQADGFALAVTITGNPGEWGVTALETPEAGEGVVSILDNHAHEFLGQFKDFEKARRRGTLYARNWFLAKHREKKKCACGPIRKKKGKR